jgi:hypothetical protein
MSAVNASDETKVLRSTNSRYWKPRVTDEAVAAAVLAAVKNRTNRSKINLYATQNYYRLIRISNLATENIVLEVVLVGTFDASSNDTAVLKALKAFDKRAGRQRAPAGA